MSKDLKILLISMRNYIINLSTPTHANAEYFKKRTELFRALDNYLINQGFEDQKQEPLTREEISYGFRTNDADLDAESYWAGVKLAEKMHGIGGEPLSNEQKRLEAIAIKQREAHGFGGGE